MGVKPFVTTEISAAGQHKNCYATWVPVINYAERGYSSWIAAPADTAFPVPEADFVASMKAGRVYAGDPMCRLNILK